MVYDPLSLLTYGITIWYATGIDDAIVFGGIMAGARSRREKWQATGGLLAMYAVMLVIVLTVGNSLTVLLGRDLHGIPIKQIVYFVATAFVVNLGFKAWSEETDSQEDSMEAIEQHVPKSWYERALWAIGGLFPRIARDAFEGFGLNCTDDIAINSANIIGKTKTDVLWYLFGNFLGVLSMIAAVWALYLTLRHFADSYGKAFNRFRACGIWFAAFLIFRSAAA